MQAEVCQEVTSRTNKSCQYQVCFKNQAFWLLLIYLVQKLYPEAKSRNLTGSDLTFCYLATVYGLNAVLSAGQGTVFWQFFTIGTYKWCDCYSNKNSKILCNSSVYTVQVVMGTRDISFNISSTLRSLTKSRGIKCNYMQMHKKRSTKKNLCAKCLQL